MLSSPTNMFERMHLKREKNNLFRHNQIEYDIQSKLIYSTILNQQMGTEKMLKQIFLDFL